MLMIITPRTSHLFQQCYLAFTEQICICIWQVWTLRILYLSSWGNKSWDWSSCTARWSKCSGWSGGPGGEGGQGCQSVQYGPGGQSGHCGPAHSLRDKLWKIGLLSAWEEGVQLSLPNFYSPAMILEILKTVDILHSSSNLTNRRWNIELLKT